MFFSRRSNRASFSIPPLSPTINETVKVTTKCKELQQEKLMKINEFYSLLDKVKRRKMRDQSN
jgi:hypothetical protein